MLGDYIDLVLEDYRQKIAANQLSSRLIIPTPAKLKEESLAVCSERFDNRDNKILRDFFKSNGDVKVHLQAIQRCDNDDFKPLINFLNKKSASTDQKNIELLAWLIDFQPRPFELGRKYEGKKEEVVIADVSPLVLGVSLPVQPIKKEKKKKQRFLILWLVVSTTLGGLAYKLLDRSTGARASEGCMYWAGTHYEPVACNQKMGDTLIVRLDTAQITGFQLITRPDTITYYSIGKVWYSKKNNKLEYFTSGGRHPVDMNSSLRPITPYIIDKYIRP